MNKYYKAEDVIRAIAEQLCWEARTEYGDKYTTEDWLEEAEDYVLDLPTIDIVHCKDCKHGEYRGDFDNYLCDQLGLGSVNDADFSCSYGERIEE